MSIMSSFHSKRNQDCHSWSLWTSSSWLACMWNNILFCFAFTARWPDSGKQGRLPSTPYSKPLFYVVLFNFIKMTTCQNRLGVHAFNVHLQEKLPGCLLPVEILEELWYVYFLLCTSSSFSGLVLLTCFFFHLVTRVWRAAIWFACPRLHILLQGQQPGREAELDWCDWSKQGTMPSPADSCHFRHVLIKGLLSCALPAWFDVRVHTLPLSGSLFMFALGFVRAVSLLSWRTWHVSPVANRGVPVCFGLCLVFLVHGSFLFLPWEFCTDLLTVDEFAIGQCGLFFQGFCMFLFWFCCPYDLFWTICLGCLQEEPTCFWLCVPVP